MVEHCSYLPRRYTPFSAIVTVNATRVIKESKGQIVVFIPIRLPADIATLDAIFPRKELLSKFRLALKYFNPDCFRSVVDKRTSIRTTHIRRNTKFLIRRHRAPSSICGHTSRSSKTASYHEHDHAQPQREVYITHKRKRVSPEYRRTLAFSGSKAGWPRGSMSHL
jgi:hypothetical protein